MAEAKIKMIASVEAMDMPHDVEEQCMENDWPLHCDNGIADVENNDNPFANWLRSMGYEFQCKPDDSDWIGIFGS